MAIVGGSGTATGATAVAITGTGICVASLAGGGTMLVPCAVSVGAANTVAAAGAVVATYGGIAYSVTSKNQNSIADAVKKAGKGGDNKSIRIATPKTNNDLFDNVKGTKAKINKKTGEIFELDQLHKNHYEVYKNKKDYEKGVRSSTVWDDGRPKDL